MFSLDAISDNIVTVEYSVGYDAKIIVLPIDEVGPAIGWKLAAVWFDDYRSEVVQILKSDTPLNILMYHNFIGAQHWKDGDRISWSIEGHEIKLRRI